MKTILLAAGLLAMTSGALAADVGVSLTIGQPGFYGHIDIGDFPPPRLVYSQPVIIERPAAYVERRQPIYLRVPPGHAKNWSKHCRAYNACNQQVYFVQDSWYTNEYAPRYRERHGNPHERDDDQPGRGHGGNGHGNGNDNGHGNGHGNGRGHGKD